MSIFDASVIRYGDIEIAPGALIGPHVVLGHPAAIDVLRALPDASESEGLAAFFARLAGNPTRIGSRAIIRSGTVIYAGVCIGDDFDCGHNVVIREGARIGDGVYVKNNTEIMKNVRIGNACRVAGVVADGVVLGNDVSSFGVLTHRYSGYVAPVRVQGDPSTLEQQLEAPIVDDGAVVGRGAAVIGRVRIGTGAVVGANAVVTGDVAPMSRIHGPRRD